MLTSRFHRTYKSKISKYVCLPLVCIIINHWPKKYFLCDPLIPVWPQTHIARLGKGI